ncbi:MAG: DUF1638 domain-containing protein [Halobacteriales archaeon]
MPGIVACEALYNLVDRFAPDAAVRYVPAELHEFPVNVPLPEAIHDRVQAAIEELDTPEVERIVVSYALGDAESELSTRHAALEVSAAADCVSTLLPAGENEFGENKAPATLYLTRGWIDCGVDSYKLYRLYRDDLTELLAQFEAAADRHEDLRYTWHRGERFEQARQRPAPASAGLADDFFRSIVEHYHRVVLVDTGDLYSFHHEYAEAVRDFIVGLRTEQRRAEVDLTIVDAETEAFEALLAGDRSSEP